MYFIAPLAALVLTVGLLIASRRHISDATAALGIVVCFLMVLTLNFSWLEPAVIGDLPKMGALSIAMVLPVALAAGAYLLAGRLRPLPRAAVSSAAGVAAVIAYPYVALILVCAFTGDCL